MKGSIKLLSGFAGAMGLILSMGLPSLAQANNPNPNILQNRPTTTNPLGDQNNQIPMVSVYESSEPVTIGEILSLSQSFEMLNALLPVAGLTQMDLPRMLGSDGSYTVFAPTDEAFAALPEGVIKALVQPENRDLLVEILRYHIVSGNMASSMIRSGNVSSAANFPVMIQANSGQSVMVNDATVIRPDIQASNGVIHAIDKVILPPSLQTRLNAIAPATTPRYSRSLTTPGSQMSAPMNQNRTMPMGQPSGQYNTNPGGQMSAPMNRTAPIQGENTTPATQPSNIIPNTRPAIENNN